MKPQLLINPTVKWACPAGDVGKLHFVEGYKGEVPKFPHENDVLTVPFILDAVTRQPVPVRVVQIQTHQGPVGHIQVVVVTPASAGH